MRRHPIENTNRSANAKTPLLSSAGFSSSLGMRPLKRDHSGDSRPYRCKQEDPSPTRQAGNGDRFFPDTANRITAVEAATIPENLATQISADNNSENADENDEDDGFGVPKTAEQTKLDNFRLRSSESSKKHRDKKREEAATMAKDLQTSKVKEEELSDKIAHLESACKTQADEIAGFRLRCGELSQSFAEMTKTLQELQESGGTKDEEINRLKCQIQRQQETILTLTLSSVSQFGVSPPGRLDVEVMDQNDSLNSDSGFSPNTADSVFSLVELMMVDSTDDPLMPNVAAPARSYGWGEVRPDSNGQHLDENVIPPVVVEAFPFDSDSGDESESDDALRRGVHFGMQMIS